MRFPTMAGSLAVMWRMTRGSSDVESNQYGVPRGDEQTIVLAELGNLLVALGVEGDLAAQDKPDGVDVAVGVQAVLAPGGHDLDGEGDHVAIHQVGD